MTNFKFKKKYIENYSNFNFFEYVIYDRLLDLKISNENKTLREVIESLDKRKTKIGGTRKKRSKISRTSQLQYRLKL